MNSSPLILLAEDDENLRFVVQDNLELRGFKVESCNNGKAGLEKFRSLKIDLCILDVMMPEMDGFELASKIREQDAHVPIIFFNGQRIERGPASGI